MWVQVELISLAPLIVMYEAHLRLARVPMSQHPTQEIIAMNADRKLALKTTHGRRLLICLFAVAVLTTVGAVIGLGRSGTEGGTQLKAQDVVAKASADSGSGYWTVTATGQVYAYGGAGYFGGMNTKHLNQPIVGMASTSDGGGYWLYGADGGVFSFGDATFSGSQGASGSPAPTVGGASAGSGVATAGPAGATGATGPAGPPGAAGATGPSGGIAEFAEFYALMPPDNAATVAPGTAVQFPQDGPESGSITRTGPATFNLSAIGTYEVSFEASVTEFGQLALTLNGAELPYTVVGRATGTSQITGDSLVQTTAANSELTLENPPGEAVALTMTPLAGGVDPVSASLVIKRIQ
jgi:hypothetical protein